MMTKIELENLDRDTLVNMLIGADNRCTELERLVVDLKNALTEVLRIAEEYNKLSRITKHVRKFIYD